jgi:hypothetical protein
MKLANDVRSSRGADLSDSIDADAFPGKLNFYNAPQPAKGGTVTTLIVSFDLAFPVAPSPVNGVTTWSSIPGPVNAVSTNDLSWARVTTNFGAFIADYTVGLTGSGADIEFDAIEAASGSPVSMDSFVLIEGNN